MCKMIQNRIISFITIFIICIVLLSPIGINKCAVHGQGIDQPYNILVHTPIQIYSNFDFTPENGVSRGNGTYSNPWIIENLSITSYSYVDHDGGIGFFCVYIYNTTDYFIIQNCYISNISSSYAIKLFQVSNGIIQNNTVEENQYTGIIAHSSSNINITSNIIRGHNEYGILFFNSKDFYIFNNSFSLNGLADIGYKYSENIQIGINTFEIGISVDGGEPYIPGNPPTPNDDLYIWIALIIILAVSISGIFLYVRRKRRKE